MKTVLLTLKDARFIVRPVAPDEDITGMIDVGPVSYEDAAAMAGMFTLEEAGDIAKKYTLPEIYDHAGFMTYTDALLLGDAERVFIQA